MPSYISAIEVHLNNDSSPPKHLSDLTLVVDAQNQPVDFRRGVGGQYCWLYYKTTTNVAEAVRGVMVLVTNEPLGWVPPGYTASANLTPKSRYSIYLCTSTRDLGTPPITGLRGIASTDPQPHTQPGYTVVPTDFTLGTGSDYFLYLYYATGS